MCKYCEPTEKDEYLIKEGNKYHGADAYIEDNILVIEANAGYDTCEVKIHLEYCPKCGKNLKKIKL